MKQRTNEEYVAASHQCPYCGSDHVNGIGSLEVEGDNAYQDIQCLTCKKIYTDEYKLVGYTAAEDY